MKRMLFLALFLLVLYPGSTEATTLYLDPTEASVGKGGTVSMAIRIDTPLGECINAADGVLQFDQGLQVADTSTGDSIFSLWVERPTYDNTARTISFAGGIPNGYCGRVEGDPQLTNTIAEVVFRAPSFSVGTAASNTVHVYFTEESALYLNDGLGTRVTPTLSGANVTVRDEFVGGADDVWRNEVAADTIPPGEFSITLTKDESAFQGKYFIVFNTSDKQTGIDHYEVIEESLTDLNVFNWGASNAPWIKAVSPYVLQDQSLNSTIRVKAIDKAGNEYVATLVPDEALRPAGNLSLALVIAGGFSFLAFVSAVWLFWRARRRTKVEDLNNNQPQSQV